ncbi:TsoY family (seleno)protein [Trueperella pyogenes]|uniref:TsoY family (seleno)protein n=1 Tax=Trueperella pyogenes TaxID=1661 RepID=UPI000D52BFDB|nr:hypothetical protein [Trueperella pyogenes]AWG04324.1 hypothetical protein DC090_07725 [Trueperella pyogenes]AWG17051.1 hypothetical protein DDE06_09655 [Trueperella pyogenes]AZR04042.1 hypothetical protein EBQ11_01470 [Trueperella pyogenes]
MIRDLHERYSPLYFLAALGFGGMSVLFFMNLMYLTPHPDSVMPTFDSIFAAWATDNIGYRAAIIAGYAGFIPFFLAHLYLLVWNLKEFFAWRRTDAYTAIRNSNAEVTLMAVPLTLGMTVNGLFIAGMIFVPGLWNVIEYLMPLAIVLYGSVGILALTYLSRYLIRVMHNGFDFKANGGLNQLLSSFAFTMVAVGLAAPAAMTTNPVVVVIAGALSLFFTVIAILLFLVFLPLGAMSMLRYGLSLGNSATLWLGVPIITLLAITYLRLRHGVGTIAALNPNAPAIPGTSVWLAALLALMVAAQLAFLGLGHLAMTSNGFYKRFVFSRQEQSPAAFTLVCPGVALSVLTFFLLNVGLVKNNISPVGSVGFVALLVATYAVQAATLVLMASLVKNQLLRAQA